MVRRYSWKSAIGVVLFLGLATLRADDGDATTPLDLGYKALSSGDWQTALAEFDKAVLADPEDAEAYFGRGQAHYLAGNVEGAIADTTKAIQLDPALAEAYRQRGALYTFKGDFAQAIADCDEAIRRDPNDSASYNNRGFAHLCRADVEKAIRDFDEAIRLDGTTQQYGNRSLAWIKQRNFDRAIADLSEALRLDSTNLTARVLRADVYRYRGEFTEAVKDMDEAIRSSPGRADLLLRRAQIYWAWGDTGRAATDAAEAIRLDPENGYAYHFRGACRIREKRFDEAIADFTEAIRLGPESAAAFEARGAVLITLGDYDRGIADIHEAVHMNPADPATSFEAWPKERILPEAAEHGERQLRQMLRDRPALEAYGKRAKPLYEWAARKFAGEDVGYRVYWDAAEPPPQASSVIQAPCPAIPSQDETLVAIRVRSRYHEGPLEGKERSFSQLWSNVVFELYNSINVPCYQRQSTEARDGRLSKHEYVVKLLECEFHAVMKTRAFYVHVIAPWAKQHQVATCPYDWYVGTQLDSVTFAEKFRGQPIWRAYEYRYDLIMLQLLTEKGAYEEAVELATDMRERAETAEDLAGIGNYHGYSLLQLDRPLAAIGAFSAVIHSDPACSYAYLARAIAHAMIGDMQNAAADSSAAIRLSPSNANAYRLRAAVFARKGDRERAADDHAIAQILDNLSGSGTEHGKQKSLGRLLAEPSFFRTAEPAGKDDDQCCNSEQCAGTNAVRKKDNRPDDSMTVECVSRDSRRLALRTGKIRRVRRLYRRCCASRHWLRPGQEKLCTRSCETPAVGDRQPK